MTHRRRNIAAHPRLPGVDDMQHQTHLKRKIAAILAADVAGYSRLVGEDEEGTLRRLAAARAVFDQTVTAFGGRIFNTAGDSVMCAFDSAVEAVRAAIEIQSRLRAMSGADAPERRLQFRIGISIGDVVERGGDLLGDGVNLAARLEGIARPGGICVSRFVHEAVANKIAVRFRDLGERSVKNMPPVHAFAVVVPTAGLVAERDPPVAVEPVRPVRPVRSPRPRRGPLRWIAAAGAIALMTLLLRPPREADPPSPPEQASAPAAPSSALVQAGEERKPSPSAPAPSPQARREAGAEPAPTPQRAPDADTKAAQAPAPTTAPATAAPPARRSASPGRAAGAGTDPAESFAQLARRGSLVGEPKTAPELYHNARLHESRGDAAAARRAYQAFAALGLELVDPHLRYATLLRSQDGLTGAREAYAELTATAPSRMVSLMHALQFEGRERRAKLEAFAAANPDFPPAQYHLAEELSEERLGTPTLTDRRLEYEALERFLEADKEGRLAPLFLDRAVLRQWLERARQRKAASESFFRTAPTWPRATFERTPRGWVASLFMPEPATSISYRIGESGDYTSTGLSPAVDPRTGKPMPMPSFELPPDQQRTAIYVTYEDVSGHTAGPFVITFHPRLALVAGQRELLERTPGAWVSFRPDSPPRLDFTQLISHRCAIDGVVIGIDGGPLDTLLPLPPCDEKNPHAAPAVAAPLPLPEAAQSVSVQITYFDGTQSEVRTFRR